MNNTNFHSKKAKMSVIQKLTKKAGILAIILPVVAIVLFNLTSCKEDDSVNPQVAYKLVNNADSVFVNKYAVFDFTGSEADNITIFTGDAGHDFTLYPTGKGVVIPTPYGKYYYKYTKVGTYTVTVYAEFQNNDGTDFKVVTQTYPITVKAAQ